MDQLFLFFNSIAGALFLCALGLFLLYTGGNKLVDGAVFLSKKMHVSTLFIGVAVIGLGTSLPEIMSTVSAVKMDSADLAYGNIIGSNIANIALVLALGLWMTERITPSKAVRKEYLFMLCGMILFSAIIFCFGGISKPMGLFLLAALSLYLILSLISGKKAKDTEEEQEENLHLPSSLWAALLCVIGGLLALFFGAEFTVNGAVTVATHLGISEKIIGLTLVAIGTSLPEIAATLAAARHGHINLTLGNVAGSNIFNALAAGGIGALSGSMFATHTLYVDLITMLIFSLCVGYLFLSKAPKTRLLSSILFIGYAIYLAYLSF